MHTTQLYCILMSFGHLLQVIQIEYVVHDQSFSTLNEIIGVHSSLCPREEQDAQKILTLLVAKLSQRMSPE